MIPKMAPEAPTVSSAGLAQHDREGAGQSAAR